MKPLISEADSYIDDDFDTTSISEFDTFVELISPDSPSIDTIFYEQDAVHNNSFNQFTEDWHVRLLKRNLESSGMVKEFKILSDVNGRYFAQVFFIDGSDAVFFVSQFCLYTALRESRNLDRIIPILQSEASVPPMVFTVRRGSSSQISFVDGISVSAFGTPNLNNGITNPLDLGTSTAPNNGISYPPSFFKNFPKSTKKIHSAKEALKEYSKSTLAGMLLHPDAYDNCIECVWYSIAFYEKSVGHITVIENDMDFEIVKGHFVNHMNKAHPDICARKMKLQDAAKYT